MAFRQLFHLLIEVPNFFYLMSKDKKVMLYTSVVRTQRGAKYFPYLKAEVQFKVFVL